MGQMDQLLRERLRAFLAAADQEPPFMRVPPENIRSSTALKNIAGFVYDAAERLTPTQGSATEVDVEAVALAAYYYQARTQHLPESGSSWDLDASFHLFCALHAVRPDAVPKPLRAAFAENPPPPPSAAEILHAVALTLFHDSVPTKDESGLMLSCALIISARESAPSRESDPVMAFNQGSVLLELFRLTGDRDQAAVAAALIRTAVAAIPEGQPVPAEMLKALAQVAQEARPLKSQDLHTETERFSGERFVAAMNDTDLLDAAIAELSQGSHRAVTDDPALHHNNAYLGNLLRIRFESSGELEDVNRAIEILRNIVDTSHDEESRRAANVNISAAYLARHISLKNPADLDQATIAARNALESANPGDPRYGQILTHLAAVLQQRFEVHQNPGDLSEAIRHLEIAVASTPGNQHDHPVMQIKLAAALRARWEIAGHASDLDLAISLLRTVTGAETSTSRHQQQARLWLGEFLWSRADSDANGSPSGLAEAVEQLQQAALITTYDVRTRIHAAYMWGIRSTQLGDLDVASSAFAVALDDLLPKLAGLALGRRSQEARLSEVPWLACCAAAVEIKAGRPTEALVRLEKGRCVLLAQALRLRDDDADLAKAAPSLAERFDQICGELVTGPETTDQRSILAAEFDRLIGEIRLVPGFSRFQSSDDWSQLRVAATQGPVVVVNVSPISCDALLLRRREDGIEIQVLPLAGITSDDIERHGADFTTATRELSSFTTSLPDRIRCDETISSILTWLWNAIAGPVLEALGLESVPSREEELPRLWWCPTGALSLLPLHAARCPQDGTYVHDRVISSYIPTLRSLIQARLRQPATAPALVAVGVSAPFPESGPGNVHLAAVEEELEAVAELSWSCSRIIDQEATPDTVLAALRTHAWAHLACHGEHDPGDPSSSRLRLYNGALTLLELTAERLQGAEFAFLSACHTAAGSQHLADEAISLASAFQLCGYPHVIGTMWALDDAIGPLMAREIYQALRSAGSVSGVARALHQAATRLRSQPHYAAPFFWASLIHTGP